MLTRLHETTPFQAHGNYFDNLDRMFAFFEGSGRVAPGLLNAHRDGFERIRAAYPWQPDMFVSCHSDPNQQNPSSMVTACGWSTGGQLAERPVHRRGDHREPPRPHDRACDTFCSVRGLGRTPDPLDQARLSLMARVTRLYVGCALLVIAVDPATPTHTDLGSMGLDELHAAFARGELVGGTAAGTIAFAKTMLRTFLESLAAPDLDESLRVVSLG